jgi:hypothetical protein
MCIRTTFIACIRRGEITGAISRGKLPYLRHRRAREPNVHPFRRFWSKQRIGFFASSLNPDCTAIGTVNVRVTKQPEHGTVETVATTDYPHYPKENIRFKCNHHKVKGTLVNYKAAEKYTGNDEFDLLILYPTGLARELHFDIRVR